MLIPIFELFYEKRIARRGRNGQGVEPCRADPFNASNQVNITKDVSPYVTSIEYTDVEHGESDELQIIFEDSEKLWQDAWIPTKGDSLRAYIGYEAEKLLNCGIFEIDELEYDTPPDVVTVKGLATGIKKPLRQKNSVGYENRTLKQIAKEIADKHGYALVGEIADVRVDRITQNQERDKFYIMPDIGEQVVCLMDENSEDGVILGAVYSTEDTPVITSEKQISLNLENNSLINIDKNTDTLTITFKNINLNGDINHSGILTNTEGIASQSDIADKTSSMQAMREIYNSHLHTDSQSGSTTAPNKTM